MIRSGRGLIRPTTSTGATLATLWPVRHSLILTVIGEKGKAGRCDEVLQRRYRGAGDVGEAAVVHHGLDARVARGGQDRRRATERDAHRADMLPVDVRPRDEVIDDRDEVVLLQRPTVIASPPLPPRLRMS